MTSEEVKELLRQLAKDTEEIGDIRSRTVRIRLDSVQEDEPDPKDDTSNDPALEEGSEGPADTTGRFAGKGSDVSEAEERRDDAAEEEMNVAQDDAGKKAGRSNVLKGFLSRFPGSGKRKKGRPTSDEEAAEPDIHDETTGTGNKSEITDSGSGQPDPVSENSVASEDLNSSEDPGASASMTAEDELITRYMDEEEKRAYLAERASGQREHSRVEKRRSRHREDGTENGADRKKGRSGNSAGKGGLGAFIERQKNTPVEPETFESDAWMFRNDDTFAAAAAGDETRRRRVVEENTGENGEQQDKGKRLQLLELLRTHRPGMKEMTIIGSIVVLALVIIAVILTVLSNKRKSERVQADEGLRITVEKEPSAWCKSGEVVLAVSTDSPIETIFINNQPVDYSEQGKIRVTFEADRNPSEVTVISEDSTRSATVGFARIDNVDPSVTVAFEDGKAILDAVDDLSGKDEIWYGTVSALSDVPFYLPYEGPFEPEKGKLYSYFAKDKAGNTSVPVTTNLSPAESISLSREEVSIFAGETYELILTTTPEKAFLNDLTWTSSDETVATVDSSGVVTALSDGKTVITAEAEGVKRVSCSVQVRSEVSVTISAVGDMTLGEDASFSTLNNFTAVYTMYGQEYFLANVKPIFEADDITFANFEGTLTDQGSRQAKEYAFRGDPSYAQVLVDGSVEAVTLANNHSYDYGDVSHTDTQKYLDEAGVDWCEGDKIIVRDVGGVRMALIGIYVLADGAQKADQVESCIAAAKEQGAQLIVVAFHWGTERETKPDDVQTMLAHLAIDSGADLVVGHHPHVLQGIEKYSGKYICYSLGNFCFGGNSNPSDKDTIIFQQTFRIVRGGNVEDGGVSVIPCSVSSVSDWNNYQPTPATGTEAERILTKLNDLCTAFGTSF